MLCDRSSYVIANACTVQIIILRRNHLWLRRILSIWNIRRQIECNKGASVYIVSLRRVCVSVLCIDRMTSIRHYSMLMHLNVCQGQQYSLWWKGYPANYLLCMCPNLWPLLLILCTQTPQHNECFSFEVFVHHVLCIVMLYLISVLFFFGVIN